MLEPNSLGCMRLLRRAALLLIATTLAAVPARAANPKPGPPLTIQRAAGAISLDGDLSDAGWQGLPAITQWFETRVGDNVEPQVKNVAYLTYDDKFFYAGFQFDDPAPHAIRAPLGDHDQLSGSTDYGGIIVDSRNDGKSAQMFLANWRGLQYDAISNDATGEDNAPDFYWDAAGKVTATGWNLEIRVPFSSLRYSGADSANTWGILLYRNYPRDRRYQFFSARLPRDVNCFICNSSKLSGLVDLPSGSHLVVAPFATASQLSSPTGDLGTPLKAEDVDSEYGVDVKWNPTANAAIDGTINPDFSQVEADVAQIAANERFALFFPEKRPFFLEGIDLFATPMQAVYTRTVTSPRGGLRATGKVGKTAYTVLGTQDRGGGLVIIPGPQGSGVGDQDFGSNVGVVRLRHDLGQSFISALATGRDIDGGGYNWVAGPDFQWRPRPSDSFAGQALWSESETPNRPDLGVGEWDGRHLQDHAALAYWSHSTEHPDWFIQVQDIGKDFRADNGFIPQVGYREGYFEAGYTIRPKERFMNRLRFFSVNYVDYDEDWNTLNQRVGVGVGMDGKLSSFTRLELNADRIRVGTELLQRVQPRVIVQTSPGKFLNSVTFDGRFGEEIDFANAREATGATLSGTFILRPGAHLELSGNTSWRWLDVDDASGLSGRLFTAQVERLRAVVSFSSRSFLRLIGQYVQTERDPALYDPAFVPTPPARKDAQLSFTGLFAYKLNWQTVFYAGYGDDHLFNEPTDQLEPFANQFFAKISYALQR